MHTGTDCPMYSKMISIRTRTLQKPVLPHLIHSLISLMTNRPYIATNLHQFLGFSFPRPLHLHVSDAGGVGLLSTVVQPFAWNSDFAHQDVGTLQILTVETGNCLLVNMLVYLMRLQGSAKADHCRKDWHQTGNFVIISFYAKACDPEQCCVEANETTVSTAYPGYNLWAYTQLNVVSCCESNQLVISLTGLTFAVTSLRSMWCGYCFTSCSCHDTPQWCAVVFCIGRQCCPIL